MKVAVLQFPGTNCEFDAKYAFDKLGCEVEIIWHKEGKLPENTDLVVVPGGFSYGDYLRSGAIARFANIMEDVKKFASNGGKVLGICNGFQILLEAGLLPGAMKRNDTLHFISKHHHLKVIDNNNEFLRLLNVGDIVNIPVAHHDGNYYIDEAGLKELEANNQILLKYCTKDGEVTNMNGSVSNIAGICNKEKNVFGLMPHPERAIEDILGSTDGINMLKGFLK
ncbi:phosphoribosylformylglycinamidine synthase subunit PurQ [Aliarcobacter skirrowii]|uniref:Phosphoribosylformylglycinamidine synthase subunit PurQ n=1 Tax=Aliarcobacter skirrowii TaxID=28200 RepID=A0A2U2C1L8_9BACT|nr:phosphoribosylformylglycinamidine synthase subunit PurQ [Aliarcobacter skirrowii]PWE20794.1 phosphoribosylformylglycinamidine synthase I [Aliarcobacter skirrowii]PWE22179.1 phosphoribosylformylglycinamidine synthase I [Aliarcobacter skirrowii]PWE24435.1 phosphoribosylformylglycinamidine synthase I [Aliarcobacter skirrowii]RJO55875.1 phosphoribosylformylglycinamidine synthase subunit PurQ [Aliarcobacter skirrowii]RJO57831.1 phosphoribosylformylglycinamidine synthase subunit PurQ [Aliarcobact